MLMSAIEMVVGEPETAPVTHLSMKMEINSSKMESILMQKKFFNNMTTVHFLAGRFTCSDGKRCFTSLECV